MGTRYPDCSTNLKTVHLSQVYPTNLSGINLSKTKMTCSPFLPCTLDSMHSKSQVPCSEGYTWCMLNKSKLPSKASSSGAFHYYRTRKTAKTSEGSTLQESPRLINRFLLCSGSQSKLGCCKKKIFLSNLMPRGTAGPQKSSRSTNPLGS